MIITQINFNNTHLIKPKIFNDIRGLFFESFNSQKLNSIFKTNIVQTNHSFSKKNVIRGLHIQTKKPQAKIITVTHGKIFDVAIDLRKNSRTFGKYVSVIISDKSNFSFYIPEGFAHGFMCLSEKCTVNYKCSKYRDAESEKTLKWNDSTVKIKWPNKNPILSKKDDNGMSLYFFKK